MANTTPPSGTGTSASAKGQAAAEAVATPVADVNPATATAGEQTESTAPYVPSDVKAKKVGTRTAEVPATAAVEEDPALAKARALGEEEGKRKAEDPNHIEYREAKSHKDIGGSTFVVGQTKDDSGKVAEATEAQKVAADDESLRAKNPNVVVYREAGTSGGIGGESFVVGQLPGQK